MKKKFIIKDLKYGFYFEDIIEGWGDDAQLAKFFDSLEDAEEKLKTLGFGMYSIDPVYIQ